jgi:hypothetical protein
MSGVLLNPRTGKPEPPESLREGFGKPEGAGPGVIYNWVNPNVSIPPHVQASLDRASQLKGIHDIRNGMQSWEEVIYNAAAVDGAAITNTTTETIMVPNFTWPNAGPHAWYVGKQARYLIWGRGSSVVTTPGTFTFRLRWGGVAGTTLVTSKAQALKTTVSTNVACLVVFDVVCRAIGTAGSFFVMGYCQLGNTLGGAADAAAQVWPDVPAAVTADTTAANALTPTFNSSVATATTAWTSHIARIEALN